MEIKIADCPLGAKCEEVKTEGGKPVVYRCPWYVQVRGHDTNTGEDVDHWNCAIAWMPMLTINTANESRKGAAATESFRNEMVKPQTHHVQLQVGQLDKPATLEETPPILLR